MTTATTKTPPPGRPHANDDGPLLVCATQGPGKPADIVLADGSYETDAERVFWKSSPDTAVLRVPLQASVVTRPLRHHAEPDPIAGAQRLLAAVDPHRAPTPAIAAPTPDPARARLAEALRAGQVAKAEAVATLLCRREGLAAAHQAIADCLAKGAEHGEGILQQRAAATTARAVLERLRSLTPEPSVPVTGNPARHQVVLAVAPGDQHTMGLTALAHQLQEVGYAVLVVEDVPLADLASFIAHDQALAVVVSAHMPWPPSAARTFLDVLRRANPDTLLVLGGPAARTSLARADLVTSDVRELLKLLRTRTRILTPREREVLLAVAEGRTTNEIAQELGLSPATVRTHLDHIFTKTATVHRAAAVARALRRGWIT